MGKESSLEELKKDYLVLQKKYNLPSFKELNEEFDIEKAAEHETDCLIREIRKAIMDKVIAYLRFVEMLINPTSAPMFFFALVKCLTPPDKKALENIYGKLGSFEIDVIELDCHYVEKKEAEFVKKMYDKWQEIEKEMLGIVETLRANWNQKLGKNEKGYLG